VGRSWRGHRGHKEKSAHSAQKNREDGSPCQRNRHKSHLDRVHSLPHRHKPKKEYRNEGDKQGGPAEKSRPTLPTLKLGSFDGSTCLATFLAKFTNCSEYYQWSDLDQLCHLRNALEGRAGQVLWELGPDVMVSQLIKLLKNRFGTQDQTECYRLELKARKRRKNESLQSLYQGCKRDLSLRDRDETETFSFWSETRPRPRPSCNSTRPRRDRDV